MQPQYSTIRTEDKPHTRRGFGTYKYTKAGHRKPSRRSPSSTSFKPLDNVYKIVSLDHWRLVFNANEQFEQVPFNSALCPLPVVFMSGEG